MLTRSDNVVNKMKLGERKLKILSAIVEMYIKTGEPVGSKTVCSNLDITVSPATVRNEMANLVEMNLLKQPHTSAGRIPSNEGYRVYVNNMVRGKPLTQKEKDFIDNIFSLSSDDPEHLIKEASQALANMTKFTAIFTTPPGDDARIRDIQFVQTGKRSVMVVLMTSTGMIKNRLFRCNYDVTPELLKIFREVLKEKLHGKLLTDVKFELMNMVADYKSEISLLMAPVINAVIEASNEAYNANIKLGGKTNLLSIPEMGTDNIIKIFSFLDKRESILDLMLSKDRGINIFIGNEIKYPELKNSSVIVTRYKVGNRSGAIGLIGPTRMDYSSLVTKLEYFATSLETMLGKILDIE